MGKVRGTLKVPLEFYKYVESIRDKMEKELGIEKASLTDAVGMLFTQLKAENFKVSIKLYTNNKNKKPKEIIIDLNDFI